MVHLRPMRSDEFEPWLAKVRAAYVADRVAAGEPEELARRTAEQQHAEYFPEGRPDGRHAVFVAEADGEAVGVVWSGPHPRRPDDPTVAWLYEIEVVEAHRARGYGRAMLAALEEHLRAAGVSELSLNVFGGNDSARRLYASAGYREVAITMSKPLS